MERAMQVLVLNSQAVSHAKRPCTCRECGRHLEIGETVYKQVYAFRNHKQYVCEECVKKKYVDVNLRNERYKRTVSLTVKQ